MSRTKDYRAERLDEDDGAVVEYHPRAANASIERLRRLAGIITLKEPIGPIRLDDDDEASDHRARD